MRCLCSYVADLPSPQDPGDWCSIDLLRRAVDGPASWDGLVLPDGGGRAPHETLRARRRPASGAAS